MSNWEEEKGIEWEDVTSTLAKADMATPSPTSAEVSKGTIAQDASGSKPARVPTINEWPEHERRQYDTYQQELAMLEWTLALEKQAVYGEVRAAEPIACVLTEEALRKSWSEWLEQADDPSERTMTQRERMDHDQWLEELYAAEQLAREQALDDERIADL